MKLHQAILLWFLFACMGFGLGYPILNRYDPTQTPGTIDTRGYSRIITGEAGKQRIRNEYRVLQPMVGKIAYHLYPQSMKTWPRTTVALLFSSIVFVASSALLIVLLAERLHEPHEPHGTSETSASGAVVSGAVASEVSGVSGVEGSLAACLFLLNFWVPNNMLIGMVDAAECLFLILTLFVCRARQYYWLPVLGLLGTASKETYLVLGGVMAFVHILLDNESRRGLAPYLWLAVMGVLGLIWVSLIRFIISDQWIMPWEIAGEQKSPHALMVRVKGIFLDPGFYYPWFWLLPLALFRVKALPRASLLSCLGAAAVALLLGIYHDSGGANVSRPMFSVMGATTLHCCCELSGFFPE